MLTVQLDGELLERAKKRADEDERTVTSLVRIALKKYLNAPAELSKAHAGAATPSTVDLA